MCATDVSVLYGTRPNLALRYYGAVLAPQRPPCFRERGMRVLLAAAARSAGIYCFNRYNHFIQDHFHPQDRIVNIVFLTAFTLFVLKKFRREIA